MNQIKIGKFIAERRKQKNLTQSQLAEKLNITDKAVSKWERGVAMPDSSIMLELCDILEISVNELLSGEKFSLENNQIKNQELFVEMSNEMQKKNKFLWISMWVILSVCLISIVGGAFIISEFIKEELWQSLSLIGLLVVFIPPCFFALKLEVSVGCYKCKQCGCEIVPTYSEAVSAIHFGTTRYLKCPRCKRRTWFKKVIK